MLGQCPRVMGRREGRVGHEVRAGCQSKCQIPPSFVSALINDHVGLEVHNKINELNLIIANQLSERVIEDVVEAISEGSKSLTSEIALKKKRSLTPDVLKSGGGSSASASPLTGTTGTPAKPVDLSKIALQLLSFTGRLNLPKFKFTIWGRTQLFFVDLC